MTRQLPVNTNRLSVSEAAAFTGFGVSTIKLMVRNGTIPCHLYHRKRWFLKDELRPFLEQFRTDQAAAANPVHIRPEPTPLTNHRPRKHVG